MRKKGGEKGKHNFAEVLYNVTSDANYGALNRV